MTFSVNYFLAAMGLLWLPLPSLARGEKGYGRGRGGNPTMPGLFRAWQNWADLIRAAAGTYALLELSIGVEAGAPDAGLAVWIKDGILSVGLVMQVIRFRAGPGFLAPLFYLTGVTLILPGYEVGAFAVVVGWIFVLGAKDARFLLPVMGASLGVSGYFLSGLSRGLLLNCGMICLPIFLALLLQRRLVFVSRERTQFEPARRKETELASEGAGEKDDGKKRGKEEGGSEEDGSARNGSKGEKGRDGKPLVKPKAAAAK